jgi:hypothetical protein
MPAAGAVGVKTITLHGTDSVAIVDDDMEPFLRPWRWRIASNGYVVRDAARKVGGARHTLAMHRIIAGLVHGDPLEVDHINHNRLDNRRENLRLVTRAQNNQNQPARSGFRGVHRLPSGRWCARASINRQQHHIGVYDTEFEAARAAEEFRAKHMPHSLEARLA